MRREDFPRQRIKHHRGIGIDAGVAQALLAEIGDDIGLIAHQRQQRRGGGGVQTGVKLQVAHHPVGLRADLRPAEVKLRLFQRIAVLLQRDVAPIVTFTALDQQILDTGVERTDRLLAGLPVVRTLSRSD